MLIPLRSFATGRFGEINCVYPGAQFAAVDHISWPDLYNVVRPNAALAAIRATRAGLAAPEQVDSKTDPLAQ
jgi:hypothetical protein